jgi:hypothetical protein
VPALRGFVLCLPPLSWSLASSKGSGGVLVGLYLSVKTLKNEKKRREKREKKKERKGENSSFKI